MIGKTILHYKILEKLAEGGMGIIYKAEDLKLQREVVLKFLPPDFTTDSETKQRFVHEAQAASRLDHPNICTIYDIQETDTDQMFIAMAYYKGETLKQKLERGSVSLEQTLDITIQITEGLARAHEEGIIHRDIKPANIMLTDRGEVKILDFGLAKLTGRTGLTREGIAVGTAAYMSPEQASGDDIDHRSDIWSVGVILYEIICEKLPFQGDTPRSMVYSILSKEPDSLSDCDSPVPEEYKTVVMKCLSKDRKKRYQKISDLHIDLIMLKRSIMREKLTEKIKSAPTMIKPLKHFKQFLIPVAIFLILAGILVLIPATGSIIKGWLGIEDGYAEKHLAILFVDHYKGEPPNRGYNMGMFARFTDKLMILERYKKKFWIVPGRILRKENVDSVGRARTVFNVNLVISGSLKRAGNTIELKLDLIDSEKNRILKSERLEGHITNLTVWQEGVILKITEMLEMELTPKQQSSLTAGNTSYPGAFNLYLQGLGVLSECSNEADLDRAVQILNRAVVQDNSYADAYLALAEAYLKKYELTKDQHWLGEGIKLCDQILQVDNRLFPVYLTKGKLHRESGEFDLAIKEFEKTVLGNPSDFAAFQEMAFTYQKYKKLYKAEEMYKNAITLRPDYWKGYAYLGYFYYSTGRLNEAEEMYLKVIELNPVDITSLNNLISIYNKKGDNIRAHLMFKRSIAEKPNSVAYSNMGTNLFYQGRFSDSREMYEEAIRLGSRDRRIWGNLADSYRYLGSHKKRANQVYQQAVWLSRKELLNDPQNVSVHSSLGLYLSKLGHYKQALEETEMALKMEPNNLVIIYNAIVVFEIAGKRHRALQTLDDYIERQGSIAVFSKDPDLSKLRNDLRYQKRVKKPKNSLNKSENVH